MTLVVACVVVGQFSTVPARPIRDLPYLVFWGVAGDLGVGSPVTNDAGRIDLRIEHDPLLRTTRSLTVNVLPAPDTQVTARVYLL